MTKRINVDMEPDMMGYDISVVNGLVMAELGGH